MQKPLYELAKEMRESKKLSLRDLAVKVGCSHQLIQFWENGKRNLDDSIQKKICEVLGLDASVHYSLSVSHATVAITKIFHYDPEKGDKARLFLERLENADPNSSTWETIMKLLGKEQ